MNIHLIAVGDKMPRWVRDGYEEYARRLPPQCALRLVEVPAGRRAGSPDTARIVRDEGERALRAVPRGADMVALEVGGRAWSTDELARRLSGWLQGGRDLALLVGGPEGNAPAVCAAAPLHWSLSPLTLPHPLVRVVVAEQLYRAWTILQGHPYHRA